MKLSKKYLEVFKTAKAVLFDLDGTLIDSMWLWKQIDKEFLESYGYEVPDDLSKAIEGISVVETAHYFINRFNITDSAEKLIDTWNDMAKLKYENEVGLKDGVFEFLEFLRNNDIKIGICSSNTRFLLDTVLESLKISDMFGVVISGADVKKGKPDPECYLKGAKALGVDPSLCIVFEDLIPGIEAGKNANMKVFAIEDNYSMKDKDIKIQKADYYLESYKELFDV